MDFFKSYRQAQETEAQRRKEEEADRIIYDTDGNVIMIL